MKPDYTTPQFKIKHFQFDDILTSSSTEPNPDQSLEPDIGIRDPWDD